jgi:alpha-L-fucosidase
VYVRTNEVPDSVLLNNKDKINPFQFFNVVIPVRPAKEINCIILEESLQYGQRIKNCTVSIINNKQVIRQLPLKTIGKKRIVTFPKTTTNQIIVSITEAKLIPILYNVSAYLIDEKLIEQK